MADMASKKYYHRKLVRDKIPDLIKAHGDELETTVLDKAQFEKELRKKLVEESKELIEAKEEDLVNELADVLELVKSLASHHKIPFKYLERYQAEKRKKRGGFGKRIYLVWSTGKS